MVKVVPMRQWMAAAVLGCAMSASTVPVSSACKTLADADNVFVTSLLNMFDIDSSFVNQMPLSTMLAEFNTALPWLSTCVAAIDVSTITTSMSTSSALQSCIQEIESFDLSADGLGENICSMYKDKLVSCVNNAVSDILVYNLENTDGCCDAFQAKIKELFSDSISVMVDKLLKFTGNVVCSTRTFTSLQGTSTTELCGYSILNSISNFEDADILDLAQIPNAGMCDAFEGRRFTNTKGGTSQFAFNTDGVDSMGICVRPTDALLTHMRTWPIFQQTLDGGSKGTFSLTDLFANDKSIRADKLVAWFVGTNNLPMILMRTLDNVFNELVGQGDGSSSQADTFWGDGQTGEEVFNALAGAYSSILAAFAAHIPNSANCKFDSQEISEPFSVSSTGSVSAAVSARLLELSMLSTSTILLLAFAMLLV